MSKFSRRRVLAAGSIVAASSLLPKISVVRAATPLKLGLVLPYSSVYATLGEEITKGVELAFAEQQNAAAGRPVELLKQDTEVNPKTAIQVTNRLPITGAPI